MCMFSASKTHGSTRIGRVRPQSSRMCFWRDQCSKRCSLFAGRRRSKQRVVAVAVFLAVILKICSVACSRMSTVDDDFVEWEVHCLMSVKVFCFV